jgi:inosine-uridine nucleoside N-ribohydrolase
MSRIAINHYRQCHSSSSAGNQTPEKTLRNVLRMLTLLNRADIPVAGGAWKAPWPSARRRCSFAAKRPAPAGSGHPVRFPRAHYRRRNVLRMLTLLNRADIPVAGGAWKPLMRDLIIADSAHYRR